MFDLRQTQNDLLYNMEGVYVVERGGNKRALSFSLDNLMIGTLKDQALFSYIQFWAKNI